MKYEMPKNNRQFNYKEIERKLSYENKFISNLLSSLPIPTSAIPTINTIEDENETKKNLGLLTVQNGTARAHSLEELQSRLKVIQSKKKLNYKEKLLKKGLKNRLKKKTKKDERSLKHKLIKVQQNNNAEVKPSTDVVNKVKKPIFNSEGKMVFSKFDFSGIGGKHDKKVERDPKKILLNLEKQKDKLKELTAKGETEKVIEIKEKFAWKNALAKADGQKIKDDPILLKKSIKKKDQQKKTSQKKWKAREESVKKAQDDRQKKRNENIAKQKKDKKTGKIKKAVKRGKIIPGF